MTCPPPGASRLDLPGRALHGDARERLLEPRAEHLGLDPRQATIFECAFGTGFYLAYWRRRDCRTVMGVDLSPATVANNRRRFPEYDLRADDVARLAAWADWGDLQRRFNLVTAIDVVYHIVDEEPVERALSNLADLVAAGGILLVTEKFPAGDSAVREQRHVVRRPLGWYRRLLGARGLVLERTRPVFCCMDPPIRFGGQRWTARAAYCAWASMRLAIKFWPQNSMVQNVVGAGIGWTGAFVDRRIVRRLRRVPNLTIAVFRRRSDGA